MTGLDEKTERFASRWGLLASLLGMAIGAGNIWRFPRVAAANGGGAFLIPWAIFLFLWSIPLMLVELGMGRATRRGPVGAFHAVLGRFGLVPGLFVAVCTTAILFYYAVVTGWCAYTLTQVAVNFEGVSQGSAAHWARLSGGSGWAILFHLLALGTGLLIISRGVTRGLERANKILIPLLFLMLMVAAGAGLSLPGGAEGLEYLFHVDLVKLAQHKTWLEALSQSAWSTGAGWGLILTYAVYTRRREDALLSSLVAGVGNNAASLLAAMAILPAVFALAGPAERAEALAGNTGLLFVWMPRLFAQMPGGQAIATLFFLAVTVAALTSLLAMLEMATRVVMDFGLSRRRAVLVVGGGAALGGLPSAWSLEFFNNQDWVWGLGLLISGAFFGGAALYQGGRKFREVHLTPPAGGLTVGLWFEILLMAALPVELVAMLSWWIWGAIQGAKDLSGWLHPLSTFGVGTCLVQWGVVLLGALLASGWLHRRARALPPALAKGDVP